MEQTDRFGLGGLSQVARLPRLTTSDHRNVVLATFRTGLLVQGGPTEFNSEIEVFYMLFDRYLSNFSMASVKQNIDHFNIRCKIK